MSIARIYDSDTANPIWNLLEKKPVQHAELSEKKVAHTASSAMYA